MGVNLGSQHVRQQVKRYFLSKTDAMRGVVRNLRGQLSLELQIVGIVPLSLFGIICQIPQWIWIAGRCRLLCPNFT